MLSIDEAVVLLKFNNKHISDLKNDDLQQLAEWLEELKAYREIGTVEECKGCVLEILEAYNKAIDDLMEKVSECFISDADWNYLVQDSRTVKGRWRE